MMGIDTFGLGITTIIIAAWATIAFILSAFISVIGNEKGFFSLFFSIFLLMPLYSLVSLLTGGKGVSDDFKNTIMLSGIFLFFCGIIGVPVFWLFG